MQGESQTLGNLGVVYYWWGQYAKAVEYYQKDLTICRRIGEVLGEGIALNNLGAVYKEWGQYAKAEEYYEQDLAISRKIGNEKGEAKALVNLGQVYAHSGDYHNALANFTKGLAIYQKIGIPLGWAKKCIGELYLDMGDIEKAEPVINEAGYDFSLDRLALLKSEYAKAKDYYKKQCD